jgi:hypothetical protein
MYRKPEAEKSLFPAHPALFYYIELWLSFLGLISLFCFVQIASGCCLAAFLPGPAGALAIVGEVTGIILGIRVHHTFLLMWWQKIPERYSSRFLRPDPL